MHFTNNEDCPVVTAKTLRPEDHVKETHNDKKTWEDSIGLEHIDSDMLRELISTLR